MRRLKLTLHRDKKYDWLPADDCSYCLLDGNGGLLSEFCAAQFHAATGFKLKPGEKKRIEIVIKEIP